MQERLQSLFSKHLENSHVSPAGALLTPEPIPEVVLRVRVRDACVAVPT